MKLKNLAIVALSLLFPVLIFAEKTDLLILRKMTQDMIKFINSDQDKQTYKQVKYDPYRASTGPGSVKTGAKSASFTPKKYDFSNKTPYGEFKVLVFETTDKTFDVSFSSEFPIQGYQLMDSNTKNITAKESLNDMTSYSFSVNRPFEPKYVLVLSMYKDSFVTQNIVPLYQKANVKFK